MSAEVKAMDAKKMQQTATVQTSKEPVATTPKATDFVAEIKTEFSKISWTDPEELRVYTKLVVGATFIIGMGIYGIDLLIQAFLSALGSVIQFIFG